MTLHIVTVPARTQSLADIAFLVSLGAASGCSTCHSNGSASQVPQPAYVSMCQHVSSHIASVWLQAVTGRPACMTCHSDGANECPQEGGSQGHWVTSSMCHVAGHRGGHSCQAHQGMETCHHLRQVCDGHAAGQVGAQSAPSPHGPCNIFSKACVKSL